MMAKNKTRKAASKSRDSRDFPGEIEPRPPIVPYPLSGTFVATYVALGLQADSTNQGLGDYTPQTTIVCFVFKNDGTHSGEINRNIAGVTPNVLSFKGTYSLSHNDKLNVVDGEIRVELLRQDGSVSRTQVLYAVRKSHDSVVFMLRESRVEKLIKTLDGPMTALVAVPANAIVHGTMDRVS
jgi:hypothetical protein